MLRQRRPQVGSDSSAKAGGRAATGTPHGPACRVVAVLVIALLTGWCRPAAAQPVLDVSAVPSLDAAGRASYARFLMLNLPRAYAVGAHGGYGDYGGDGAKTIEIARAKALEACAAKGGTDCAIYAENLNVIAGNRPPQVAPPPPPLVSTWNYSIVPDDRYIWRGPAAAAGVYVWAHGLGALSDARGHQPQMHVRAFNNAGFDVLRFDRVPNATATATAPPDGCRTRWPTCAATATAASSSAASPAGRGTACRC